VSIALVGLAILAASRATALTPLLIFWLCAGAGNALGTVAYETLLQEHTPDAYRGRVIAASEAVIDAAFLVGGAVAGALASGFGARGAFVVCGAVFLVAAVASRMLLGTRRAMETPSTAPLADLPSLGAAAGPGSVGSVHPTAASAVFELESFEHVPAGHWELVRLIGCWHSPVEEPAILIVDDGVRVHRIPALPQLAPDGLLLRAGFPVAPELLANRRSAFALEVAGGWLDLPRPLERPAVVPERELELAA
jgi:MFS family permease